MRKLWIILGMMGIILSSCGRNKAMSSDDTNSRYKGQYYGNRPKHLDNIPDAYARHPYVGGGYSWQRQ